MGSANQMAGVNIAQQNQTLAAQMGQQNQQFGAQMDFETSMAQARGAQGMQDRQYSQMTQLFDIAGQRKAAADAARANQRQNIFSGIGKIFSDRRLKKNIKIIGKSPSGINIYSFEYKNPKYGKYVYQGVMADEIPSKFVGIHSSGYNMVDYSCLDVEFKLIK